MVFVLLGFYVTKYPKQNFLKKNQTIESELAREHWDAYQDIDLPAVISTSFDDLSEDAKTALHKKFLIKIQKCLMLSLTYEEEMQLIYNLLQGSTREAVLRGLLSKLEVTELMDLNQSPLLSKEISDFSRKLNNQYLQRDDFELPIDMRMYELKILLMEEFLNVAEKNLNMDERRFYLWSGHILRDLLGMFSKDLNNHDFFNELIKIPKDHLLSEVPLAVCHVLDNIPQK